MINHQGNLNRGGGHFITKHMGGCLEGLTQKPQNIYPTMLKSYSLNILKVQSENSKISNLGQIFIFTENCTLIIHMNHFSYPLTVVQINIFEEPQNIFSQPKSQTPSYRASPPPRILTIESPLGI